MSDSLETLLHRLFAEQLARQHNDYLAYHASPQAIRARVASFVKYKPHLPNEGRLLEWGCQHGSDACLVRAAIGDGLDIFGCDFVPDEAYPVFWSFSGMHYRQLTHAVSMPFESDYFDCVIGAGVLEHVAMDYESLKELHRLLKPGGTLILTYLPNRLSYTEFASRRIRRRDFHNRLYTVAEISQLLKHTGFLPLRVQRHRWLPTNSLRRVTTALAPFESMLERIWPINLFCGDILVIARKVLVF